DGTEDELIFDSERLDDINVDQTDKENDIFVDDDYEEVDGFRNIW
ncbi:11574_t:CDS:1, partial [Paraglomus brasilianum]